MGGGEGRLGLGRRWWEGRGLITLIDLLEECLDQCWEGEGGGREGQEEGVGREGEVREESLKGTGRGNEVERGSVEIRRRRRKRRTRDTVYEYYYLGFRANASDWSKRCKLI